LAARLVELALGVAQHLPRLAGGGLAGADLGGLARDLGLERSELVAPRRELLGAARALAGDVVDLAARAGDPAVELLGLPALEADLALAEPDPVVELVDLLLDAHQPALLDGELGALGDDVGVLRAPGRARVVELAARRAEPAGDQLVLAGEL